MDSSAALLWLISAPYKIVGAIYSFAKTPLGLEAVGAFIGIYFAYALIELIQERKDINQQIRNINTARSFALSLFQHLIIYKKEHTYAARRTFLLTKRSISQQMRQSKANIQVSNLNFSQMVEADVSVHDLRESIMGKLTIAGRTFFYFAELSRAVQSMNAFKSLINEMHFSYVQNMQSFFDLFAPSVPNTIKDVRYPIVVKEFYRANDLAIYLCKLIIDELGDIGKEYETGTHATQPKLGWINFESNSPLSKLLPSSIKFPAYTQRITRSKRSQS